MNYNRDFFIFGEPITTIFGEVRFLTFREFQTKQSQLSLMSMNSLHIYYYFLNESKGASKEELEELKALKETPLLEIVNSIPQFKSTYESVFSFLIKFNENSQLEDMFKDNDTFAQMRKLILDMNVVIENKVSPDEEIQRGIERSRRNKQQDAEKQSFVDIVTSIVASTSNSFSDVCNMNVMQVYAIYSRIGAIFNYQSTTLFATVAEKVNIELWNKHIDLFHEEEHSISYDKFLKTTGNVLSD